MESYGWLSILGFATLYHLKTISINICQILILEAYMSSFIFSKPVDNILYMSQHELIKLDCNGLDLVSWQQISSTSVKYS